MPVFSFRNPSFFLLFWAQIAQAGEVVVSAASSLQAVLIQAGREFEQKNSGVKMAFQWGASGALRVQIENGAPVDLYFTADMSELKAMAQKGLLISTSQREVARNLLAVVVPSSGRMGAFAELADARVRRVAVGNPATAPVGRYARESLANLGLEPALKGKTVYAESARQVLDWVERGEVDAGILFVSDARASRRVKLVSILPESSHPPIRYGAAVVARSKKSKEAMAFLDFLKEKGEEFFQNHGFP